MVNYSTPYIWLSTWNWVFELSVTVLGLGLGISGLWLDNMCGPNIMKDDEDS